MAGETLARLKSINPAILTEVVRQDQRSATFDVVDWTVKALSHKGVNNPDGLFLFSGQGRDEHGTRPWSVVLKMLRDPGVEQNPQGSHYWKREILAAQSGLLANLPGPLVAPRYYGTSEHDGSGWIWMEHIVDTTDEQWTVDQYAFAAHQLGLSEGAYLTGKALPNYPWLSRNFAVYWAKGVVFDHVWDDPFVSRFFSSRIQERVQQLWAERESLCDALEHLPFVFSHYDFHRRNLFLRQRENEQKEAVAVDWAWSGCGPIGSGIASMVYIQAAFLFREQPVPYTDLHHTAFEAYLRGLRDAGWTGNSDLARLGYTGLFAIVLGLNAAPISIMWTSGVLHPQLTPQFGISSEKFAAHWAEICEFALDLADEAHRLMNRLGL